MKKLALTIMAALAIATPVMAVDDATVLSPGTLYGMIQSLTAQVQAIQGFIQDELNKGLTNHEDRISALEVKTGKAILLTGEDSATAAADAYRFRVATVERLQELERKMQGVQKQITLLHSKKADKETKK